MGFSRLEGWFFFLIFFSYVGYLKNLDPQRLIPQTSEHKRHSWSVPQGSLNFKGECLSPILCFLQLICTFLLCIALKACLKNAFETLVLPSYPVYVGRKLWCLITSLWCFGSLFVKHKTRGFSRISVIIVYLMPLS